MNITFALSSEPPAGGPEKETATRLNVSSKVKKEL